MKSRILDQITTDVQDKTFASYVDQYKTVHCAMTNVLEDTSVDYEVVANEIAKQFECIRLAYGRICDMLAEKKYIKRDYKGIYQVEPTSEEDKYYDYMDILKTADASFTAARDIKKNFDEKIRDSKIYGDKIYYRIPFECKSTLAGLCLIMQTLLDTVSKFSDCYLYSNPE